MIPLNLVVKYFGVGLQNFIEEFHLPSKVFENWQEDLVSHFVDGDTSPDKVKERVEQQLKMYLNDKAWLFGTEEVDNIATIHTYYIMLDLNTLRRIGTDPESQQLYDVLDI